MKKIDPTLSSQIKWVQYRNFVHFNIVDPVKKGFA